jgi:RNA polymerase sigma-70 factor (ECF subfamily)
MADPAADIAAWLAAARAGSREALGHVLEACRGYLLLIAQHELEPELQAKGGASDLVQQTFLEAQKDLAGFHGDSPDALLAWLRRLLLNNLANFRRDLQRARRSVSREVALTLGDSSTEINAEPPADTPSPSEALKSEEQIWILERAVERLPEDYRQVIHLRYREERSFDAIAELMNRSPNAVRKLWARAIEALQQELETPP